MAINVTKQSGHITYNLMEYVIDTEEDFKDLPSSCAVGSIAFCIEDSKLYMLNSSKEWIEINK